jgi:sensor domain CHASE-containing protein
MSDTGWHLDKRVPVSIIGVLFAQLVGGIWMAAQMNGDIKRNASDIARVERSVEIITNASQTQAIQLGRIEEQVSGLRGDIHRVLRVLEQGR